MKAKPVAILVQTIFVMMVVPIVLVGALLGFFPWLALWIAGGIWLVLLIVQLTATIVFRVRNPHGVAAWTLAQEIRDTADKRSKTRALELYDELDALVQRHPGEPALPGILAYAATCLQWHPYPESAKQRFAEAIRRHLGR